VVAKVTPTLETTLGYKLFLMFGTINILGMGVFSWYALSFDSSSFARAQLTLLGSFPRPKAAVWRIWISYLGPSTPTGARLISESMKKVRVKYTVASFAS
jgi:hypothetical protein